VCPPLKKYSVKCSDIQTKFNGVHQGYQGYQDCQDCRDSGSGSGYVSLSKLPSSGNHAQFSNAQFSNDAKGIFSDHFKHTFSMIG
jgi:hypothetical protein